MLTLRRQEKEQPPSLTHWLTSSDPVQQQYAAKCLAEMGDTHGTDCLILLASLEDRKRRRVFFLQSIAIWGVWLALLVLILPLGTLLYGGPFIYIACWLFSRKMKVSRLQRAAVEKLADMRHPAALPTLLDTLWRSEPALRGFVIQGLIRLLPRIEKETSLSKRQWDLLLAEIAPIQFYRQQGGDTKFLIAILKAVSMADYFPATGRIKKLANFRKTIWIEETIQSVAAHCFSQLEMRRQEIEVSKRISSTGQQP